MAKCKRWVFTSFDLSRIPNYEPALHEYPEICPDIGRGHLQGFAIFKNRKYFGTVKSGCQVLILRELKALWERLLIIVRKMKNSPNMENYQLIIERLIHLVMFCLRLEGMSRGDIEFAPI